MSFGPGTRLGPYEIEHPLGAGGMGEVYRARDTRLGRLVALKVLPAAFATDPERRERLQREARAIANVANLHICMLHDVGHDSGVDYLVMEYIEGETLASRLAKGPLPLHLALRYASQIATGLSVAHRAGIVHRDLKPANIMLTKVGAKLLDFGLAKALSRAQAPGDRASTVTGQEITVPGSILGTVPYMAPEQLDGGETDARTDIFAFGAVLFEMVSGRKAFDAPTQSRLIVQILEHEPPDLTALQPLAPLSLQRLVQRCVAKDPDDRWQSTADLANQIGWIYEHDLSAKAPARAVEAPPPPIPQSGACHHCNAPVRPDARFCPSCGQSARDEPSTPSVMDRWIDQGQPPRESTSGKAIASLVCGIFFMVPLASIAAVILGHRARGEIRRSDRRLRGARMALIGLVLGYIGCVFWTVSVFSAIAVPGLLRARISGNEAAALAMLRQINSAQAAFSSGCGGGVYAPSLSVLAVPPVTGGPAWLDSSFAEGRIGVPLARNGYVIEMKPGAPVAAAGSSCAAVTDTLVRDYLATAVPMSWGQTGGRFFATSAAGTIYENDTASITAINADGVVVPGGAVVAR